MRQGGAVSKQHLFSDDVAQEFYQMECFYEGWAHSDACNHLARLRRMKTTSSSEVPQHSGERYRKEQNVAVGHPECRRNQPHNEAHSSASSQHPEHSQQASSPFVGPCFWRASCFALQKEKIQHDEPASSHHLQRTWRQQTNPDASNELSDDANEALHKQLSCTVISAFPSVATQIEEVPKGVRQLHVIYRMLHPLEDVTECTSEVLPRALMREGMTVERGASWDCSPIEQCQTEVKHPMKMRYAWPSTGCVRKHHEKNVPVHSQLPVESAVGEVMSE